MPPAAEGMLHHLARDREAALVAGQVVAVGEGVDPLLRPHRVGLHLVAVLRPVEREKVGRPVRVQAERRDRVRVCVDERRAPVVPEGRVRGPRLLFCRCGPGGRRLGGGRGGGRQGRGGGPCGRGGGLCGGGPCGRGGGGSLWLTGSRGSGDGRRGAARRDGRSPRSGRGCRSGGGGPCGGGGGRDCLVVGVAAGGDRQREDRDRGDRGGDPVDPYCQSHGNLPGLCCLRGDGHRVRAGQQQRDRWQVARGPLTRDIRASSPNGSHPHDPPPFTRGAQSPGNRSARVYDRVRASARGGHLEREASSSSTSETTRSSSRSTVYSPTSWEVVPAPP